MTKFDYEIDDFMCYCQSKKLSTRTMRSYEQTLRLFAKYLEDKKGINTTKDVTKDDVKHYIVYLQEKGKYTITSNENSLELNRPHNRQDYSKPIKNGTINNYIRNLKVYFNYMDENYLIKENPVTRIKFLKAQRTKKAFIKDKEAQKEIANKIIETGASVRETENIIRDINERNNFENNNIFNAGSAVNNTHVIEVSNLSKWRTAEEQCVSIEEYMGNKAVDVSKQNLGYDVESIDKNKNKRYIEVKSIVSDTASFTMTNNEYSAANMYKDDYYLCLLIQTNKKIKAIYI